MGQSIRTTCRLPGSVPGLVAVLFLCAVLQVCSADGAVAGPDAGQAESPRQDLGKPRHIGTMTAFWRSRPVLGRWLKGRLGLTRVPDYLCDPSLSFPYRKRPYPEEVMFADHLTVVRLLGGWKYAKGKGEQDGGRKGDLAYRDASGKIRYRWALLGPRLDHYVKNGYTLTIVLDNTPWCFPASPVEGSHYGQSAPPADFAEWGEFVAELCRQLVKRYGFETVNQWRFRMGTECQGTQRFTGTQEEFFKLYDYAAAGVNSVLPGAKFGPFNLAGDPDQGNVKYNDLADHCAKGTNYATGETGSPLDFAAVSLYMAPSILRGILRTTDPDFKASTKIKFWNGLSARDPKFRNVSREVHEFGILGNEFKIGGCEPGAHGAAWTFHIMMNLLEGGVDRMWHWGATERVWTAKDRELLTGHGWLFCVLEQTVGGQTYVLTPRAEPAAEAAVPASHDKQLKAIAGYVRPVKLNRPGKTFFKSVAVVKGHRVFIITSAYNEDRFVTTNYDVTVSLPRNLVPLKDDAKFETVALTRTNSLYFRLRQDLDAAGLLVEEYKRVPGVLSSVRAMGGRQGWSYVDKHWPRYERIIKSSLTLKPFKGKVVSNASAHHFTFQMAPPAVVVVVVDGTEPVPE